MREDLMNRPRVFRLFLVSLLCLGLGCQIIKRKMAKPAEGVIQKSSTVRFTGYEQTVTVSASHEELSAFLNRPNNWINISGMELAMQSPEAPTLEEQMQLGSSFPLKVKKMGIEVSGRMILVKATPKDLWFIWDNPEMMQIQRWKLEPMKEGTRLTINVITEAPETMLNKVVEEMGIAEIVCREIDYMLAKIQAHFNPSLNPDELVAKGLRGEFYETLFPVQETSVWVKVVIKDAILEKLLAPDKMMEFVSSGNVEGLSECLAKPENKKIWEKEGREEPVFCPITAQVGRIKWKGDAFITRINPKVSSKSGQDFFVTYGVIAGIVYRLQITGQAEKGGTQLRGIFLIEPPGANTSNLVEALVSISGLPQWLEKLLLDIKAKVEGFSQKDL